MAGAHGNRTHLPCCSHGTLDLKSRRPTRCLFAPGLGRSVFVWSSGDVPSDGPGDASSGGYIMPDRGSFLHSGGADPSPLLSCRLPAALEEPLGHFPGSFAAGGVEGREAVVATPVQIRSPAEEVLRGGPLSAVAGAPEGVRHFLGGRLLPGEALLHPL